MVKDNEITMKCLPAHLYVSTIPDATEEYKQRFESTKMGWKVMMFRASCENSSSPFCFYHNHKEDLRNMVLKINGMKDLTNVRERYRSYADAVRYHYPHLGEGKRVRLGVCFVKIVRVCSLTKITNGLGT